MSIRTNEPISAALKAHEIQLGVALEAVGMITWEWNIATESISYFGNLGAMVRGDALGPYCSLENLRQKIHPEDRNPFILALDTAIQERTPFECEYRICALDQTYRWILSKGKIALAGDGKPARMLGISIDITERKQAEERLRQSEARFRLLSDTAGRLLAAKDPLALVKELCGEVMRHLDCQVFFNFLVETGPSADADPATVDTGDHPQRDFNRRMHLNAYAGIPREVACQIEGLDLESTVCGCVAREGKVIVVEDIQHGNDPCTTVIRNCGIQAYCCHPLVVQGCIIGTLSFGTAHRPHFALEEIELMRTIADQVSVAMQRLKTLQALEMAHTEAVSEKNRLDAVMETLPVGVCLLDDQGGIVRVNPNYEKVWGGPRPHARGIGDYGAYRAWWVETGQALQSEEWASARAVQQGEIVINQELRIQRFDGSQAYVLNSAAPIRDAKGQITGCAMTIQDITEHKRTEELRRQLELQMQQSQKDESLGVLAGGIAHDFNNLLTVILGNIGLAYADLSEHSPVRVYLEDAEKASHCAADLCQQILAYVGKAPLSLKPVDLNDLLQNMFRLIAASVSKDAQICWDLADALPLVQADPIRLRQIIMSLLINASEAIGEQPGRITIKTGSAFCNSNDLRSPWLRDSLLGGQYAFLEVTDTGCGIEASSLKRVFDPFYSTKFLGRGLGLPAVLGIVRRHAGTIQVRSVPGQGSTFRVWLPTIGGNRIIPATPPTAAPLWRGSGTVLVVDDEEGIRSAAKNMLSLLGFDAITAAHGKEALEIYREDPDRIWCVLLDVTMPQLGGEATFQELVRIRRNVRVVLTSGYAKADVLARFTGAGLAGFLQKPYTVQQFAAVFQSLSGEDSCRPTRGQEGE